MTTKLPPGIITTSDSVTGEIERIDTVHVDDVSRLWRAFATNRHARLENYFWRIWGNDGLRRALPGSTVARLFMQISDDGELIRTTPVQSPRAEHRPPVPPSSAASEKPVKRRSQVAFHNEARPASPSPEKSRTTVLPSILKKPRDSFRGGDALVQGGCSDEGDGSDVASAAEAARPPTPPKGGDVAGSARRKKATFVAGSASARRRPGVGRRRSSQSSANNPSSGRSPTPPLQRLSPAEEGVPSGCGGGGSTPRASSSGRLQREGSSSSTASSQEQARLVDQDFRTRFADRTQKDKDQLSALSLHPAPSKSMAPLASTATVAMGEIGKGEGAPSRSRAGKGKGRAVADAVVPPRREGPSVAGDDSTPLARTKSQLTMLLEKDRRHGER